MRAVIVREPGGSAVLEVADVDLPIVGPDDVLIRVVGAGLNRADLLQRQGLYPPPRGVTDVLGLEVSGHVEAVGENVGSFDMGDPVVALLAGGGYAEFVSADYRTVLPAPEGVDLLAAAALPEAAATVWSNLFITAGLEPDEWLLVHGGASGIGSLAIQLAKSAGANVITTVGSAAKAQYVADLGADVVINYNEQDFVDEVQTTTGGRGCDVVLDIIGAAYLDRNLRAVGSDGRLIIIGLQGGAKAEINLGALLAKRVAVIGTSLRSRPLDDKQMILEQVKAVVWPLVTAGMIGPSVDRVFALDDVAAAHDYLEAGTAKGKVLLSLRA